MWPLSSSVAIYLHPSCFPAHFSLFNASLSFRRFQSFIISSWPSLTHCLSPPPLPCLPLFCHHPYPCQSAHLLPSPPFFSFTFSYLSAYPSLCHLFFSFSGGKADEWLDRAIPLLRGYRFNLRGHGHQQLGVLSKWAWSLGKHRINDLSVSSGRCSLVMSTSWESHQ